MGNNNRTITPKDDGDEGTAVVDHEKDDDDDDDDDDEDEIGWPSEHFAFIVNNNNNNNKDERERDEDNVVVPVDDRDTAHRRFLPRCPFLSMMVALVVLAIVLSLMLVVDRGPNDDGVCKDNDNTPPSFPYMTGVSLVTDYAVKSSINVRLAKTTIKLQVSNELECGFDPQIDFATSPRTGSCIQIELGGQESSASLPCSTQVTPRVALNHDRA